jgi:hypothetical protein
MKAVAQALQDAPGSPEGWVRALQELSRRFGCTFSGFVRWNRGDDSQVLAQIGLDESFLRAYHQHYAAVNPWIRALHLRGPLPDGAVLPTERFVPAANLRCSEFYNDFAKYLPAAHGIAAQINSHAGVLHLSLIRGSDIGEFTAGDLREMEAVMPNLRAAVAADRHTAEIRAEARATRDALDALGYPVFVLGRAPFANTAARQLLAAWPSVFRFSGGTLTIAQPDANAALQRRLSHASRGALIPHSPFTLRIGSRTALRITVIGGFAGAAWALLRPPLVMIEQIKPRTDVEAMLASRYGLTPREAQFVVTLTVADQVRVASDNLGISAQTGRLHLARACRKIGVHSQRELMALLRHLSSE